MVVDKIALNIFLPPCLANIGGHLVTPQQLQATKESFYPALRSRRNMSEMRSQFKIGLPSGIFSQNLVLDCSILFKELFWEILCSLFEISSLRSKPQCRGETKLYNPVSHILEPCRLRMACTRFANPSDSPSEICPAFSASRMAFLLATI